MVHKNYYSCVLPYRDLQLREVSLKDLRNAEVQDCLKRVMAMGVKQTDTSVRMKKARKDTLRKIEDALMDHEFLVEGAAAMSKMEINRLNQDLAAVEDDLASAVIRASTAELELERLSAENKSKDKEIKDMKSQLKTMKSKKNATMQPERAIDLKRMKIAQGVIIHPDVYGKENKVFKLEVTRGIRH